MKVSLRFLGFVITSILVLSLFVTINVSVRAAETTVSEDTVISTVVEEGDAAISEEEVTIPETETPKRISPSENGNTSIVSRVVLTVTVITLVSLALYSIASYLVRRRNYK